MQEYDDYDHQHHQQIVKRVLDASIFKINYGPHDFIKIVSGTAFAYPR